MPFNWLAPFIIIFTLSGCEKIAERLTPIKKPIASTSKLAMNAEQRFWETLHQGQYDHIPDTITLLMAAYLENPNDPKLAAHLGFMHIWKITERQRLNPIPPTIVDEMVLAKKYFSDAVQLNPHDARFQGFLGDSMLAEGSIFHDKRQQVRAYFKLKEAIGMWPEFNYFTAGYLMSNLASDSKEFKEGLDWQWQTLDLCAETKVNRDHPDFSPYMKLKTQTGPKRACWNSWIAPHNIEGFFLNMGDMLVKAGDWQRAILIYENAKLSDSYNTWPYKSLIDNRILNAKANVSLFQQEHPTAEHNILFNSGKGCVICHQAN